MTRTSYNSRSVDFGCRQGMAGLGVPSRGEICLVVTGHIWYRPGMKARWSRLWGRVLGAGLVALACGGCGAPPAGGGVAASSPGAQAPTEPTGNYGKVTGDDVVGGQGLGAFKLQGDAGLSDVSQVAVEGQAFAEALRIKVKDAPPNPWDLQLSAKNATPVASGDILLATFHFRTEHARDESGEGRVEFVFELARDPWTKSATHEIRAGSEWKQVHVPFKALGSFAPGEAQMNFRVGFLPQTIELGGITVENFGKQLALADLPVAKLTYRGMEADAEWRAAAAQRIEQHRKGELMVVVQDPAGAPVAGAEVRVELLQHAFGFGSCVAAARLVEPGNDQYRRLIPELFNWATIENNLKWQPLAGDWGGGFTLERAKRAVAWLRAQGLGVHGHVLVWPGWRNLPKALRRHEQNPKTLRAEVASHVRELTGAMRGQVDHWDVMNEPFDNHDLMDIFGDEVMLDWFKIARETDPRAKLFINDYAILSGGGGTTPHRDHYEKTIRWLLDRGAPLDAIGLQGHFGTSLTAPDELLAILDRYAKLERPIWVTEYDIVIDDEQLAGSYTRDFYTALFSHPAVQGVILWGFWDGAHWKKNAALYRQDWTLKPAGQAYRDLVLDQWRTDTAGQTDDAGRYVARGFLGRYRVTVKSGKQTKVGRLTLARRGAKVTVKLD